MTIRPDEDVQCALAWRPVTWWVVDGERVDPPAGRRLREPRDPLLLMGAAGVSGSASIRLRCPVEEPVALFIDLGGEPVEVGSLKDPGCGSRGPRAGGMSFVYRYGGLETPAAWLDPRITDVETREGLLAFALEMLNDTDETITIGRCPFYEVRFTTSSKEAELRSYLNCPAAPDDLRPGDVARFLIELPLGGLTGEGRLGLELRDENRTLQRVELDGIEVPG